MPDTSVLPTASTGVAQAPRPARRRPPFAIATVAPAFGFMILFFLVPTVAFSSYSFLTAGMFEVSLPLTLDNYSQAVSEPINRTLALHSLQTGALVAAATVAIALPMAYWLRYLAGRWQMLVLFIVVVAMLSSYLVRIYSWRTILGENGVINGALTQAGIIDAPLPLLFNQFAVTVAGTHLYLPFVIIVLYTSLRPLDAGFLEAAHDLGANAYQRWWRVILPALAAPIVSSAIFVFVLMASDWLMPSFLGGPNGALLGQRIWQTFRELGDYALGAALSILTLLTFALMYLLIRLGLKLLRLDKVTFVT